MSLLWRMPLYWRVCVINAVVFVLGTLALALAPVTVSARVLASEAVVLAIGLTTILVLNALLLRSTLRAARPGRATHGAGGSASPGERLPRPATVPSPTSSGSLQRDARATRDRAQREHGQGAGGAGGRAAPHRPRAARRSRTGPDRHAARPQASDRPGTRGRARRPGARAGGRPRRASRRSGRSPVDCGPACSRTSACSAPSRPRPRIWPRTAEFTSNAG